MVEFATCVLAGPHNERNGMREKKNEHSKKQQSLEKLMWV